MCNWPSCDHSLDPGDHPDDAEPRAAPGGQGGGVVGSLTRRLFVGSAAAAGTGLLLPSPASAHIGSRRSQQRSFEDWGGTSVVLLGTAGGPLPTIGRCMTSQAVVVDGATYLVDCGAGVVRQMVDAGIPQESIRGLFITHLHGDHVNDYFATVIQGQPLGPRPGFQKPIDVYGPGPEGGEATTGTEDLNSAVFDAFATTVTMHYPSIRELVVAHDIAIPAVGAGPGGPLAPPMEPFLVHQDEHVRVTAVLVDHLVFPTFAFRFDTADGAVVFSGDTVPTPNLVRLARGSDVLVHEIMFGQAMIDHGTPEGFVQFLLRAHTDVTQVGKVADAARVEHLVLSHVIELNLATPYPPTIPDAQWVKPIRRDFGGAITMGADLMRIPVPGRS